jgi:hypothetical protein
MRRKELSRNRAGGGAQWDDVDRRGQANTKFSKYEPTFLETV